MAKLTSLCDTLKDVKFAALSFLTATLSFGDERVQKLLQHLASATAAFEQNAPNLVAEETLTQRAEANGGRWQTREIQSEYAFAYVGKPAVVREIRKVINVDGKTVNASDRALTDLVRTVQSTDGRATKRLLEDFEKHGLIGTVTDLGQLLLLFDAHDQEKYAFSPTAVTMVGADRCLVFRYTQHDGPGAMTIFDEKSGRVESPAEGEVWVSMDDFKVVRVTIRSVRGEGSQAVRDEAQVDYTTSGGVPVPVSVVHREYRKGALTAENLFTYSTFRRIGSVTGQR